LSVPDPNRFDGAVRIKVTGSDDWTELPTAGPSDGRGLGVLDLARALRRGAPARASGEIGLHVLDTMEAIERSITQHTFEPVRTSFNLPDAVDPGWDPKARTVG